jgi:hypothetical protein
MTKRRSLLLPGLLLLVLWLAAYYALVRPSFMSWGATPEEAVRAFLSAFAPAVIEDQSTRALTIEAPPGKVWERFIQLGLGRSGFYSYSWLENLFLAGIRNDFRIVPEWQARPSGEFVRSVQFGAPTAGANGWTFEILEPGRSFFLNPGWGPFVMEEAGPGRTRLLARTASGASPRLPVKALLSILFDPAHFIMEKRMMLTVGALAEGRAPFSNLGTAAGHFGFALMAVLAAGIILTRRRRKLWILAPLVWAAVVLGTTRDPRSALAAFTALALITAGFRLWGKRGWLFVLIAWIASYLTLIYARDAYVVFGLAFTALALPALLAAGLSRRKPSRGVV